MRGKSLALLVLALGCGLVASLGITQVLAKRGDSTAPADTMPVYVAKADIATGTPINDENVKVEQWPKDKVPAGAVIRKEDIDGRHARQKIYAGEAIIEPKLLAHGEVPTDSMIPKDLRVVAITVSPEAIHNGLVLPGTRCDLQVFIRADPSIGVGKTLCKTILQDIKVFAVNDVTSTESADPKAPETKTIPNGKTVSLLVTPTQAQIVTLASQMGTIRLILRSGDDNGQPKTAAMTAEEMIGANAVGDRAKENPVDPREKEFQAWVNLIKDTLRRNAKADPTKVRESEERRYTMRVRSGADAMDVLLVNNSSVQGLPGDEGAWTSTAMGSSAHGTASADAHRAKTVEVGPTLLPAVPVMPPKMGGSGGVPSLPATGYTRPPNG